jgi:hypothetical protein
VAEIAPGGLEVHSDKEMNWIEIEEFEGISITEEWLLKFGFQKSNLAGYDQHFQYYHPKLNNPITALYNADFSMDLDGRERVLKHVHQLQNAFFVIADEELTLTGDPYPKTIEA